MGLLEIKKYLMQVKVASLVNLCAHFKCDSDVLRNMMNHWLRKGCIRKFITNPACGSKCNKCSIPAAEIYEWISV